MGGRGGTDGCWTADTRSKGQDCEVSDLVHVGGLVEGGVVCLFSPLSGLRLYLELITYRHGGVVEAISQESLYMFGG